MTHRYKYSKNKTHDCPLFLVKKIVFPKHDLREMPEHDMKKMTEEFLKSTDVKIEIMRFHRSKNVIDEYSVYICLL